MKAEFRNRSLKGNDTIDASYLASLIDQLITEQHKAGSKAEEIGDVVLNNSGTAVVFGRIYGRDSAGKITPASATVLPLYYAESGAAPGQNFKAKKWGQVRVKMNDTSDTLTIGGEVYIAASGSMTPTIPTSGNIYRIGFCASTTLFNGMALIDLDLSEKTILFS